MPTSAAISRYAGVPLVVSPWTPGELRARPTFAPGDTWTARADRADRAATALTAAGYEVTCLGEVLVIAGDDPVPTAREPFAAVLARLLVLLLGDAVAGVDGGVRRAVRVLEARRAARVSIFHSEDYPCINRDYARPTLSGVPMPTSPVKFTAEPASEQYRVTRREDGAVLGRVAKRVEHYNIAPRPVTATSWIAYTADGTKLGDAHSTRAQAAEALLVTVERLATIVAETEAAIQATSRHPQEHRRVEDDLATYRSTDGGAYVLVEPDALRAPTAVEVFHATASTIVAAAGPATILDRLRARREHLAEPVAEVTPEQVADAVLDRRPILDLFPGGDLTREQAETVDAGVTLATERLAARYGTTPAEVVRLGRDVIEETLSPADSTVAARRRRALVAGMSDAELTAACGRYNNRQTLRYVRDEQARRAADGEPGPEVDDPREQPAPVEWSEVAPRSAPPVDRPVRIAVDADCPGCGYPKRSYDPETGVFACSSLNRQPCDYTSTTRDAEVRA